MEVTHYIELADGSKVTSGQLVEQSAAAWNRMLVDIGLLKSDTNEERTS